MARSWNIDPNQLKLASLIVLVLQTTALVLLMRYTRVHGDGDGPIYLTSTAVFCAEVCKVIICVIAVFVQNGGSVRSTADEFFDHLISAPAELLKLAIPSGLYTLQNNLLFVALTNLDAATYQVTYQLKILTTAMFMVCMLKKVITPKQWFALCLLIIGVVFVQLAPNTRKTITGASGPQNPALGFVAVVAASLSSGFAGVYFEKLMKHTAPSLWIRNIQLGFWGSLIALIGSFLVDGAAIRQNGFFQGYNFKVCIVIALQSFGGLCVAVVIKYADNLLKVFATSISIILSCLLSYLLLDDFTPTWYFGVGVVTVLSATAVYTLGGVTKKEPILPMKTGDES